MWHTQIFQHIESLEINSQDKKEPQKRDRNFCALLLSDVHMWNILSFQEIKDESRKGLVLEVFEDYESFVQSDFFDEYYNLRNREIRAKDIYEIAQWRLVPNDYDEEWYIWPWPKREYLLANEDDMKVQRILLILWYMEISDFDLDPEVVINRHEDETSYFWILRKKEDTSIKRLQSDYGIKIDGIVWVDTKRVLYRLVYEFFHSSEREECRDLHLWERNRLKEQIR